MIILIAISLLMSCNSNNEPGSRDSNIDGYPITSLSLTSVIIKDNFWLPIIERNRTITIPYAFGKCEETGRIDNFSKAAGLMEGDYEGMRYNDSDVYKILEGACYSLINSPDPLLRNYVDSLVSLISLAQEEDGYLYTTRTINPDNPAPGAGSDRWVDVWVSHELYSAGHMYEAAVAHYLATGERTLLDVAVRNANLVSSVFGWGKMEAAPGHQEIEIGLIKLYQVTGNVEYLNLAKFFLDVRGRPQEHIIHAPGTRFAVYSDLEYLQQHLPVTEQAEAVGHAVRAAYMYSGMADVTMATGDESYLNASEKLWDDVVGGKIYITGGIGSKEYGEAFGNRFELPNMTAYTETCASVANVFWNDRLFRSTGQGKYYDVLERTLYNGLISGISYDATNFFYPNPLESEGQFSRSGWFDCSCCPSNIARFLPAMQKYIWSTDEESVYVNLFIASLLKTDFHNLPLSLELEGSYPWSGEITIRVEEPADSRFSLKVRIPSWTGSEPIPGGLYHYLAGVAGTTRFRVNGKEVKPVIDNGYATITRKWKKGDRVEVSLPMEIRRVVARDEVEADSGKFAFERGPILYCFEEADNGKVIGMSLPDMLPVSFEFDSLLMDGLGKIVVEASPDGRRYVGIPYYAWANRGAGEMVVWVKIKDKRGPSVNN
ncbi:MAG: glycoside hydrolase family 127 protein [Bacteroidales bacterium]